MTEGTYQLKSGRRLGYAVYGPAYGKPVLYFHGTPSSRLEPLVLNAYNIDIEDLLLKTNIKLIALDRPGMGYSTYDPESSFRSFAMDVNEMMNDWQIESCKILCWSGGGPYALSLAYNFPPLIQQVFAITSFTRSFSEKRVFRNMNGNVYYFWTAKHLPWLMKRFMNIIGRKDARRPIPRWLSRLPDVDHTLLSQPEIIHHFTRCTLNEACRQNSDGLVYEAAMYFNDMGYNLAEITQPVHFWWGSKDNTVSEVHPRAVEMKVPNAKMHYVNNEGHLSIFVNCIETVLQTISRN